MSENNDLVLANVQLPGGRRADLTVRDGIIIHSGSDFGAGERIECGGMLCIPGATDMHVHIRGGREQTYKEDWSSGTMSAVAGGVTTVVDQPNTLPPISTPERLRERIEEAKASSYCRFCINANPGSGTDAEEMWKGGATAFGELFAAPSSYGDAVEMEDLKKTLSQAGLLGALCTIHAEEVLGPAEDDCSLLDHDALRPAYGEKQMVEEICRMAPNSGLIHFCHLSSSLSVKCACGSKEVTPHHLFLSHDRFDPSDTFGKVNPPLRCEEERKDLWRCWEKIDVIASDHAPHTLADKSSPFSSAPSGIPGVETMMPLLIARVYNGEIKLSSLLKKTVSTPSRLLCISPPGLQPGMRADLALYPRKIGHVRQECLHSCAGWSPYEGMEAVFPEIVIVKGSVVFNKGEFHSGGGEWVPGRGYLGDSIQ